ncbi:hypothetical protein BOX15_Mlig008720g1 [Macrostomum lignano]|uniref:Tubulin-specific chaperone A n=1 Tax=Macrostomum lignano TaxID=282301 RepID=A0A267EFV8_9PLAT|nr:hypothetical protein BOX15_Mlig008720g1 [Macrostomum lignano]
MSSGQQSPSPAVAAAIKQIRIQTGVVKRLVKEVRMYQTESASLLAELEQLKVKQVSSSSASEEAEHRLRKRQEVLRESQMMVPDTERRLSTAKERLDSLLQQHKGLCDSDPVYLEAVEELKKLSGNDEAASADASAGKAAELPQKEAGDC